MKTSLNDTDTAIGALRTWLSVSVYVLLAVAAAIIFEVTTFHYVILIAAPVAAGIACFGEMMNKAVTGFVFVLIVHPFDVGDACEIDDEKVKHTYLFFEAHLDVRNRFFQLLRVKSHNNQVLMCIVITFSHSTYKKNYKNTLSKGIIIFTFQSPSF